MQVASIKALGFPTPPPLINPTFEKPFEQELSLVQSSVIDFEAPPSVSKPSPTIVSEIRPIAIQNIYAAMENRKDQEEEIEREMRRKEEEEEA